MATTEGERQVGAGLRAGLHVSSQGVSPGFVWPWATFASVLVVAGAALWSGPTAMVAPWDNFILLDGGYRITQGQAPSSDFTNPIGPLVYVLVSLGMRLQRVPSLSAVTYGTLIFLPVATFLAWQVARCRLRPALALGFTMFVGLLVIAVRPLGYGPGTTSYAMLYNRFGWVLYTILLVLVLVRPCGAVSRRGLLTQGTILGIVLGLLLYCKANFFVAGIGALIVGLAVGGVPRRLSFGLSALGAFIAVGAMFWLGFKVTVSGYFHDVVAASGAQGGSQRLTMLTHSVIYTLPVTGLVALILGVLIVRACRRGIGPRPLWRLSIAVTYILGSSVVVSAADSGEKSDLPALVVIALLLMPRVTPMSLIVGRRRTLLCVAALLILAAAPLAAKDAGSLAISVVRSDVVASPPASQRLDSPYLRDFVVPSNSSWQTAYRTASQVPDMLNDGFALLHRHIKSGESVATTALTNPFSFALALPPPRGVPLWWDLGISFNRNSHPNPEQALGGAQWVMIPRMIPGQGCCQATVETMLDLYDSYLAQHYTEAERTDNWILLRRTL